MFCSDRMFPGCHLQIILRLVIQASVLADPVAVWLRDTGNEGWRWKTIGQVVDSVCLLLATTLLLSLESTYLCVPRLKFVQAVLLLVLLLESYVLRSAYTWPAESEPITSSLKQSKQGMLMSLDMSAALLLMQGILSTLLRPRHLAFLSLPCDNKQFLAYIKLLKHKREKLSKRRMLKLHGWHSGENNCAAVKARPLTV